MSDGVPDEAFVMVAGRRMFVDSSDGRGKALLAAGGSLHPGAVALWHAALASGEWDWVVDVGANYGEMLLAVDIPDQTRVAAVEPNNRVLPFLRRTLEEAFPRVVLRPCAISDRYGSAVLYEDVTWSGNSTLCGEWRADRDHVWTETTVDVMPLSQLFRDLGVAAGDAVLVKMDIEGHEVAALRGALPLLRGAARSAVMLEVVRFNAEEKAWLADEFEVWCYDSARETLFEVDSSTADLTEVLSRPNVYRRDVIAIPRGG